MCYYNQGCKENKKKNTSSFGIITWWLRFKVFEQGRFNKQICTLWRVVLHCHGDDTARGSLISILCVSFQFWTQIHLRKFLFKGKCSTLSSAMKLLTLASLLWLDINGMDLFTYLLAKSVRKTISHCFRVMNFLQSARLVRWARCCWWTQWATMPSTTQACCLRPAKSLASAADGWSSTWTRTSLKVWWGFYIVGSVEIRLLIILTLTACL